MNKKIAFGLALLILPHSGFSATPRGRGAAPAAGGGAPVAARAAARPGPVGAAPVAARAGALGGAKAPAPAPSVGVRTRGGAAPAPGGAAPKSNSARAAATQSVLATGAPKIQTAASSAGVVSDECKNKYFGCMDSFCMQDNANGARCVCSDTVKTYNTILAEIEKLDAQALKMATDGVDAIDMGEMNAGVNKIVGDALSGLDETAEGINIPSAAGSGGNSSAPKRTLRRSISLADFDNIGMETENNDLFSKDASLVIDDPLAGLTGTALHDGVRKICVQQAQAGCEKEIQMLQMMYSTQIKSDCAGYELELKKRRTASSQKLQTAQRAMKDAALEAFQNQNKWDLGQCIVEMRKCVETTGGCGSDLSKCTYFNTGEGLSGTKGAATPISDQTTISVFPGTLAAIQSKRTICETSVVKNCVAVKAQVWSAMLIEIAPAMKAAELIAEQNQRNNRISDVADCFARSCKSQFGEQDTAGYDACLGNPAIMADNCKVELNRSSVNTVDSDSLWGFVKAKLAALRVDACTTQVKACLQHENACGEDYAKCVGSGGMDMQMVQQFCSVDKLTACRQDGKAVANWSDGKLTNLLTGIYLDIDNAAMNACQKLADEVMARECGDTTACDAPTFAEIGKTLVMNQTDSSQVTITGIVDWSKLSFAARGDDFPKVDNQSDAITGKSASASKAATSKVAGEIQSIADKITKDVKLQGCLTGRDVANISRTGNIEVTSKDANGKESTSTRPKTTARFPNLVDGYLELIIRTGLRRAEENYRKHYDDMLKEAQKAIADKAKATTYVADGVCWVK